MSTETKDKLTMEEEKKLLNLADILHSSYLSTGTEKLPIIINKETIAEMFQDELEHKIPELKLRGEVSKEIERWKKGKDSGAYSPEEISQNVRTDIEKEARMYLDRAKHIQMYNRDYVEATLENALSEIFEPETNKLDDFYKIALIFFDLNGLKTLNDGTTHENGDRALEIFSKILKNGSTTQWLRRQGVEVIPAHQSGDEFLLLMRGDKDLSSILEETKKRFHDEVEHYDASDLLDFQTGKKYLSETLKIYDKFLEDLSKKTGVSIEALEEKFSREFKFKLGTSVGIATLGQALSLIDPDEAINPKEKDPNKKISFRNASFKQKIARVRGIMSGMADENANADKIIVKAAAAKADPLLGVLQNRNVTGSDKDNTEERATLLLKNSQIESENATLKQEVDAFVSYLRSQGKTDEEIAKIRGGK